MLGLEVLTTFYNDLYVCDHYQCSWFISEIKSTGTKIIHLGRIYFLTKMEIQYIKTHYNSKDSMKLS